MGSLSSLLSIAQGALSAHAAAVDITGKNITNANTPGFVRRTAQLETRQLGLRQSGGVVFQGPLRMADRFAIARVLGETGLLGAAEGRMNGLMGLEAMLAPASENGVAGRMDGFFGSLTALSQSPNDPTARSTFLARAEEVAGSFRTAAKAISDRRSDLAGRASDVAGEVNERLSEIAELNEQIAQAQALGDGAPDLRDQRDLLVREVGDRMGVQAIEEDDGSLTLLSSGTALVTKGEAASIAVSLDSQNDLQISVRKPSGSLSDITTRVELGSLGGIRQARDVDLVKVAGDLDQLAFDFAGSVNAVHAGGVGLDGVGGRPLFAPSAGVAGAASTMVLDASMVGQPDRVAVAANLGELPGGNSNALALLGVATQPLAGQGTPAERIGAFAGGLGLLQTGAESALELRTDTLAMADVQREQASGVSLEEEMVELTRFQRAFEASMRVLKVADELLQGLVRDL